MTRGAEIIQLLNARERVRVPLERSTGLPYGWALWMKAAPAAAAPALRADELVALLAARPPGPWPRGEELTRWQALLALFRQGWQPAPRDERPLRALSWAGSAALHLVFVLLLSWIAYLQSLLPPPPRAAGGGGGERVGIGFVGREGAAGTPGDSAQGEASVTPAAARQPGQARQRPTPPTPAPQVADAAAAAGQSAAATEPVASAQADPAEAALEVPPVPLIEPRAPAPRLPEVALREVELPEPVEVASVPVPQVPLLVREVAVREPQPQLREREVVVVTAPAIQAPRPREVDLPAPRAREPELRPREVVVVDVPALPAPAVRPLEVPAPPVRLPEVRQREVPAPVAATALPTPPVRLPQVQPRPSAAPALRPREVPMPAAPSAAAPAPAVAQPAPAAAAPAPQPGESAAAPSPATAAAPAPAAAAEPAAPGAASSAPRQERGTAPGSDPWANVLADDRWGGQAQSAGPGPGLFDAQGRARLPGAGEAPGQGPGGGAGEGLAERGAPGGDSDAWTRERIEQSGTWLKRPPYDYEPTSFDRYWVPNESLLAEWVRKGIKSVAIPIPGTNGKRITCVVSLLQLGGGCGISDPNLNEQAAEARPPPDVPFKPELQEDNGSVRP